MSGKKIRIGIDGLSESAVTGTGGLVYLSNIIRAVCKVAGERVEIIVFASFRNARVFSESSDKATIIESRWLNEKQPFRLFCQQIVLPFFARRLALDVLLCPGNIIPVLGSVCCVLIVQNRLQYDLPAELGRLRRVYRKVLGRLSLVRAKKVITLSDDTNRYLGKMMGIPRSRRVVIGSGVDGALFFPRNSEGSENSRVSQLLIVSELWPYKNHEVAFRALARCLKIPGFDGRLVIVGQDWNNRKGTLACLASELGVAERVEFAGRIPHEQMPGVYAQATMLLFPSVAECFPLPVLEAMACGVPVIASNRSSFPELVDGAGICLDPYDDEAWAKAIHRVVTDVPYRLEMIKRGIARAKEYTWERAGREILRVLEDAAAPTH